MAKCDICGEPLGMPYTCNECGGVHCHEHRLPENHNCQQLQGDVTFADAFSSPRRRSASSPSRWGAIVSVGLILLLGGVAIGFLASQGALVPATPANYSTPSTDAAAAAPTPTATPDLTEELSAAERAEKLIHEKINDRREANGLSELGRHDRLDRLAEYHSEDMAERDYFAHTSPDGETMSDRYDRFGIVCPGGENIFKMTSMLSASPESVAEDAVESWMDSEGHRENILRSRFQYEGLSVVFDGDTVYVTQNFC